jgi:two-component system, NarL family, sensor histidine kinase EvgS
MQNASHLPRLSHGPDMRSSPAVLLIHLHDVVRLCLAGQCFVGRGLAGLCWASLWLCLLGLALPAWAQQTYQWRPSGQNASLAVSSDVLSDVERDYLRALPEIRVAVTRDSLPPYESVAANGDISGYQVDMLLSLARVFQLKLRPVVYPDWPSTLAALRDRQADMVLGLAVTAERMNYVAFTLGTVPVPMAVFGRSNNRRDMPLTQGTYALERDYAVNDVVQRRFPEARIKSVDSSLQALRDVAEGRADFYMGSVLTTTELLARSGITGLEVRLPITVGSGFYHLGLRKDWAPLATILNRGISPLRPGSAREIGVAAQRWSGPMPLQEPLALAPDVARWLQDTSVLRVGAMRGLSLLNDVDAAGVHIGIAADYVEHVAQRLGVGVEVVPFDNLASMLEGLRTKRIDVAPFLTKTAEREREFKFSVPLVAIPFVLIGRTDAPAYAGLGSLNGKRIAMAPAHPLRPLLAQRYPGINIVEATDNNDAISQVANGKADVAVEVQLLANLRINQGAGEQLRVLARVDELPAEFSFAVRPDVALLLPTVNQILTSLAPAERERIYRRWVAVDLAPQFPWRRWAPTIAVALGSLLLLIGSGVYWMRRLAREVKLRRHADALVDEIGRAIPGCVFRYELDAQGKLLRVHYSSGTAKFLGVQPLPGQTLNEVCLLRVDADQQQQARRALAQTMASKERFDYTLPYNHPDGRKLWLYTDAVCTQSQSHDGPGLTTTWTGYVIDVTQRQDMQAQIAREAEDRYLWLASASHELRAPAHTLALALQALPTDAVRADQRATLRIARDAVHSLSQLLDDVLDSARQRLGRTELRPEQFNVHAVFQQVADSQARLLAEKGLGFHIEVAPDVPRIVSADPLRLKQVLVNVLNNACKYTEHGHIHFSLHTRAAIDGAAGLRFVVADTGPGISAATQARLFEPFATGPTTTLRDDLRSSGLGLAHCKRLLALMKGELTVDSSPGRGTTVTVDVPAAAVASRVADSAGRLRTQGDILVCDDDPVSCILMSEMLRLAGYGVVSVHSAQEALQRWRAGGVRLLITDLHMPGMDGATLMAHIRSEEAQQLAQHPALAQQRTGLVVCSGDPAPTATDTATLHDAFIRKPVNMSTLVDTLRSLEVQARHAPVSESAGPL